MIKAAVIEVMEKYQLDAVILPYRTVITDERCTTPNPPGGGSSSEGGNALASYTGLPTIIVSGGFFFLRRHAVRRAVPRQTVHRTHADQIGQRLRSGEHTPQSASGYAGIEGRHVFKNPGRAHTSSCAPYGG